MMGLRQQMEADRALRDSARRLLDANITAVRADLAERSIGGRIIDRATEAMADMADEATDMALNNKGGLAVGAAIAASLAGLWVFRDHIVDAACDLFTVLQGETGEQADDPDRCEND
ncbi:MAG: hypothetical protein WA842_06165 [Croceibacterium sp.]